MTAAQFDAETAAKLTEKTLDAIRANPNPRSFRAHLRRALAWPRSFNREAAFDSIRNVLCVVGAGTVLGDFATMRYWMILPCVAVACVTWYIDYLRHF